MSDHRVIILVADGARPDTLTAWMDRGALPAMSRLRDEAGMHVLTTCFPSVTGPAYIPFLCGRHPAPIGLPGLRWFDRAGTSRGWGRTRSYVGHEMRHVDTDLAAAAPTIFELVPESLGALSVIRRGLAPDGRVGMDVMAMIRTARIHFTGNVRGWLEIDRRTARDVATYVRERDPRFVFAALTGVDKTSHQKGHDDPIVGEALEIVDGLVATLRADAEERGTWDRTTLLVVSDHGHSPVRSHEDLAGLLSGRGHKVIAHPWVNRLLPDVAVMVSGNAMAHLYVDLDRRERPGWHQLRAHWNPLLQDLLKRPSVDLALVPLEAGRCEVHTLTRGRALVSWNAGRYAYEPVGGDPLGLGGHMRPVDDATAFARARDTDYPDSLVQIARIADAPRSGDIILSASRDWDFRARYEPIEHVSSHGALHREHMLVPMLSSRPLTSPPRRTIDVFTTALDLLGIPHPESVEGVSAMV